MTENFSRRKNKKMYGLLHAKTKKPREELKKHCKGFKRLHTAKIAALQYETQTQE